MASGPWWPPGHQIKKLHKKLQESFNSRGPFKKNFEIPKFWSLPTFFASSSQFQKDRKAGLVLKYLVLEQLEVAPYPHNHAWEQRWIKEDSERKQLIVFRLASSHRFNAVLESIRQAWYGLLSYISSIHQSFVILEGILLFDKNIIAPVLKCSRSINTTEREQQLVV